MSFAIYNWKRSKRLCSRTNSCLLRISLLYSILYYNFCLNFFCMYFNSGTSIELDMKKENRCANARSGTSQGISLYKVYNYIYVFSVHTSHIRKSMHVFSVHASCVFCKMYRLNERKKQNKTNQIQFIYRVYETYVSIFLGRVQVHSNPTKKSIIWALFSQNRFLTIVLTT